LRFEKEKCKVDNRDIFVALFFLEVGVKVRQSKTPASVINYERKSDATI